MPYSFLDLIIIPAQCLMLSLNVSGIPSCQSVRKKPAYLVFFVDSVFNLGVHELDEIFVNLFPISLHKAIKLFPKMFLPKILLPPWDVFIRVKIGLLGRLITWTAAIIQMLCFFGYFDWRFRSNRSSTISDVLFSLFLFNLHISQLRWCFRLNWTVFPLRLWS